jgi:hypothetical protein
LARGFSVLHASQADFAEQGYASFRERFEIFFDHSVLDHRRTGVYFDAAWPQRRERTLSRDCHGLEADDIARPSGRVHFAG